MWFPFNLLYRTNKHIWQLKFQRTNRHQQTPFTHQHSPTTKLSTTTTQKPTLPHPHDHLPPAPKYLQLRKTLPDDERPQVVKHAAGQQPQPIEEEVLVRVDDRAGGPGGAAPPPGHGGARAPRAPSGASALRAGVLYLYTEVAIRISLNVDRYMSVFWKVFHSDSFVWIGILRCYLVWDELVVLVRFWFDMLNVWCEWAFRQMCVKLMYFFFNRIEMFKGLYFSLRESLWELLLSIAITVQKGIK